MKALFPSLLLSCLLLCGCTDSGTFSFEAQDCDVEVTFLSSDIVRVAKFPSGLRSERFSPSVVMEPERVKVRKSVKDGVAVLETDALKVFVDGSRVYFEDCSGNQLLSERRQEYSPVDQTFVLQDGEALYGLGQHQQGVMNWRGKQVHLCQVNMEIAMPLVHSSKGYALFWNNSSITDFKDSEEGMTFASESGEYSDYYFVYGGNADGVISGLRRLTGQAPMFPLWSYGFIQSRERYATQDEVVDVVKRYRDLGVPLDCIVQDWRYWGDDHHWWNAVEFLSPGFPDPAGMMEQLRDLNANAMISIWPSFGPETNIYKDLDAQGLLMPHETFPQDHGVRNYDPWNPKAREIYWNYIRKNMADIGIAGWWLDATEPEHNPIKPEDYDFVTAEGAFRDVRNSFPIVSTGGVYDSQRRDVPDRRVMILTRSAYPGQQRYGTHVWSGDVHATWEVLEDQIPAALNFSLCGMPYWNSDIGGFWTWQQYPDGVDDPEYHKLYVRWMQFATFTGMMRSHGSNTPREIFRFGERGTWAFDAQEKFINLRYRLLPYIYANAWQVTSEDATLMRHLIMDWPEDVNVPDIDDEYMFGKSFLVAPVVTPEDVREVYLPEGQWFDFWNGVALEGGRKVMRNTPVDEIPLYVRAGSVIPVGPTVQYAAEKDWSDIQLRIYPGADGEFTLYEDAGDGYGYEKGERSEIRMTWDDAAKVLTIHPREGKWAGMPVERTFRVVMVRPEAGTGLDNGSSDVIAVYNGAKTEISM